VSANIAIVLASHAKASGNITVRHVKIQKFTIIIVALITALKTLFKMALLAVTAPICVKFVKIQQNAKNARKHFF